MIGRDKLKENWTDPDGGPDEVVQLAENALKSYTTAIHYPMAVALMAGTVVQASHIAGRRKDLDIQARRALAIDMIKRAIAAYKEKMPHMKEIFDDMERRLTMPCMQCEETGKWKWGETGECEYDSQEACEAAHAEEHE